jgi:hypothetical protein
MKELFYRLLKSLGISGRDWAVLLLALLLAFSIWLIHNLSLKYNDFLTVPVVAQCGIEGHADISSNQAQVTARCRATGYDLIRHSLFGKRRVHTVVFRTEVMRPLSDDVYYVTASDLQEYSHLIFGDDVTVEYFGSDSLFFTFPAVDYRKVPVHPVYSISYEPQHANVGDLAVKPDSVTVHGELSVLENIDRVYTKPLKKSGLSSGINGVIALEPISKVRFSVDEVSYSLDVVRYVEIKSEVSVGTRNVPVDKEMVLLPSKVTVSMKCRFPLKEDPASSLDLYVDYSDFVRTISGKCPVRHDALPSGVISCEFEPFYVECIARDR